MERMEPFFYDRWKCSSSITYDFPSVFPAFHKDNEKNEISYQFSAGLIYGSSRSG